MSGKIDLAEGALSNESAQGIISHGLEVFGGELSSQPSIRVAYDNGREREAYSRSSEYELASCSARSAFGRQRRRNCLIEMYFCFMLLKLCFTPGRLHSSRRNYRIYKYLKGNSCVASRIKMTCGLRWQDDRLGWSWLERCGAVPESRWNTAQLGTWRRADEAQR